MSEPADRIVTPQDTAEDRVVDASLRPKTLDEFVGQPAMRENPTSPGSGVTSEP